MGSFRTFIIFCLVGSNALFAAPNAQMYFFLSQGKIHEALNLYEAQFTHDKKHDPEFIEDLSMHLLQQGVKSDDPEIQLLALYGASFGSTQNAMTLCDLAMRSGNPMTQLATIQLLGHLQDDRCEELLVRAFSSQFLPIRFEAGQQLAIRKAKQATGLFQSLMHHLPDEFHVFFPDLFALIGTQDALSHLKKMLSHRVKQVQLASILAVANHRRDDFLPQVRSHLTHKDPAEQEAASYAVGMLQDLTSLKTLEQLKESASLNVRIAALSSMIKLGDHSVIQEVKSLGLTKDPFVIAALKDVPTANDTLALLLHDPDRGTRCNAALALLPHRDPRAIPTLLEILIHDASDIGLYPIRSLGGTMMSWKVIPSKGAYDTINKTNVSAITTSIREYILTECAQFSEPSFLRIARAIFDKRQNDLVPTTVHLLETIGSQATLQLLNQYAEKAGTPLVRDYCRLALYRSGEKQDDILELWVKEKTKAPLISFRPLLSWSEKTSENSQYTLTPEEESRLYIETLMSIANKHSDKGINTLIRILKEGNSKNSYAIAGLLLYAIQ